MLMMCKAHKPVSDYSTQKIEMEEQKSPQTLDFTGFLRQWIIVDNVDKKRICLSFRAFLRLKKSTLGWDNFPHSNVDNVDNYLPRSDSPISTTFPAPIVINKSPFIQFSNKNFSISSKEGK